MNTVWAISNTDPQSHFVAKTFTNLLISDIQLLYKFKISHLFFMSRFTEEATLFFSLNWSKYVEVHGGLDLATGGLWITNIAHSPATEGDQSVTSRASSTGIVAKIERQVLADPGQQTERMATLTSYWGGFGFRLYSVGASCFGFY
ncbi:Photosystem I P700 chlorophyll a apoprotein A1 [Nymphaea thermarum]|nr:Photosystem I P700 chlorophyll a apoprotein A1 [Nymphaea thermarum]